MKKFKVIIYRDGGCFRKYKEEWEVKAEEYYTDNNGVTEFLKGINGSKCNGSELVASFKADKYTILQIE